VSRRNDHDASGYKIFINCRKSFMLWQRRHTVAVAVARQGFGIGWVWPRGKSTSG
jgi:hypothetical protein